MTQTIIVNNECYIYMNGKLIHKKYIDHSQSGVTFDVMAYRKNDSLKSITDDTIRNSKK
jgi:hydroxymethylpyrimidine pyrophosphatase-like HAD family hydrolase